MKRNKSALEVVTNFVTETFNSIVECFTPALTKPKPTRRRKKKPVTKKPNVAAKPATKSKRKTVKKEPTNTLDKVVTEATKIL